MPDEIRVVIQRSKQQYKLPLKLAETFIFRGDNKLKMIMKKENKEKVKKIILVSLGVLGTTGLGVFVGTKIVKLPDTRYAELIKENNRLKVEKRVLNLQLIQCRNGLNNACLRVGRLKEQMENMCQKQ